MKTIESKLYKFSELSDEAKEKALNQLSDINVDFEWWGSVYDDANDMGLKIYGFDIGRGAYCKGRFILSPCEVAQNILHNYGESCETYKTASNFMEEWQPICNNYMDETHEDYESSESADKMGDLEDDFLNSVLEDYRIILQNELREKYDL